MTATRAPAHPRSLAVLLVVTGVVGWIGAFVLVLDRLHLLENPGASLSCDINPFISCATVIESRQGSLFGFPNPLIGVAAFVVPIVIGMALFAGARFARWFWTLFALGTLGGWVFVTWLFTQSVFVIGALCPYCLLVWSAMIPLWWGTLSATARAGLLPLPAGIRRAADAVAPYTWAVVVLNYAIIVVAIISTFPALIPTLLG
ncbi:vitamin K epoxide reductase family protein [Clavibacter sp. VKM Ac-2873]|uniref:vitamin K epoxide reductase family protein n=1 Tax=Clavibacter sp. VKM Ac-2873 TaxID=2783813 RepID=UPI00188A33CB|nr:vitamin K epoxide reductase family protein [Clavibacter sp. VKM Ac-2873]MBF4616824.1 vitamin K epoxide reductase family protein [Clavibacter sp. VKM Ac-2873]